MKYLLVLMSVVMTLCVYCVITSTQQNTLPSHIQRQKTDPTPEQIELKNELIQRRKTQTLKKSSAGLLQNITELGPNKDGVSLYGSFNFADPSFYSGMVKDIAVHRNDTTTIVIATETSGAWLCINDGSEFQCQPIDDDHAETRWETVVQHPDNNNIFFVGGRFDGLYYTDISTNDGLIKYIGEIDGIANQTIDDVNVLRWDEDDPTTFFVAGGRIDQAGNKAVNIYRFNAIDNSFVNISSSLTTNTNVRFGEIEVLNDGSIVVCRKRHFYKLQNGNSGTGLLASYNTGWGQYMLLASHDNIVYSMIYTLGVNTIRFYRSIDYGQNWAYVDFLSRKSQKHDQALEVFDVGSGQHLLLSGTIDAFAALVDNSITDNTDPIDFKLMNFGHEDYHGFERGGDYIYAYNDGGLFRATENNIVNSFGSSGVIDFGVESINQNLPTLQANSIWYKQNSDEAVLGFWHNGAGAPSAGEFEILSGGDGFDVAVAPNNDSKVYTTSQNGTILRNGTTIKYGDDTVDPFWTQLFVHSSYASRLYYVNPEQGIWRTNNGQNCGSCYWGKIFDGEIGLFSKTFTQDDPSFYFTRQNGNTISFFRINDLVAPFSSVQTAINLNISVTGNDIEQIDLFKHHDHPEGVMFLLVRHADVGHSIYKIEHAHDDGINATMTEVSNFSDFVGMHATQLFVADCDADKIIIGTEYGLYNSDNGGQSFIAEIDLPAVEITNMEYKPSNQKIFISTYGRGGWMAEVAQQQQCNNPFIVTLPYSYTSCGSFGGAVSVPLNMVGDITIISDPSGNLSFESNSSDYAIANDLVPGVYEIDINGEYFNFEIIDGCDICVCPEDITVPCSSDNLEVAVPLAIWAQPLKECIALGHSYTVLTTISNNVITTEVSLTDGSCTSTFTVNGTADCDVFDLIENYSGWINTHFPNPEDCLLENVVLHDDMDKFIDGISYTNNPVSLIPENATLGAMFYDVSLNLYFRTLGNSCSNDIVVQVTDPAGNAHVFSNLFDQNTCNQSILLNTQLELPFVYTLGNSSPWTIEYRNTTDSNAGDEYSVRYAGISYGLYHTNLSECPEELLTPSDCQSLAPHSLVINQPTVEGDFYARESIISTSTSIQNTAFKAGNAIELHSGFEVNSESTFSADIDDCIDPE